MDINWNEINVATINHTDGISISPLYYSNIDDNDNNIIHCVIDCSIIIDNNNDQI